MISDVLSEAVDQMREYLDEPLFQDTYEGQTREELEALAGLMDCARARLDVAPEHYEGEYRDHPFYINFFEGLVRKELDALSVLLCARAAENGGNHV